MFSSVLNVLLGKYASYFTKARQEARSQDASITNMYEGPFESIVRCRLQKWKHYAQPVHN